MSAAELLTIVNRRKLVLRQFRSLVRDDRAEGTLPDHFTQPDDLWHEDPTALQKGLTALETLRHCCYIQCWHRNSQEHSALWRIYADRGVAVRSKISRLCGASFWSAAGLRGDDVVYANNWPDIQKQGFEYPAGIVPNRLFLRTKRRPFAWEQEWRVSMQPPPPHGFIKPDMDLEQRNRWLAAWPEFFEIEIEGLGWIDAVVVDARMSKWAFDTIHAMVTAHEVTCELGKV